MLFFGTNMTHFYGKGRFAI